MSKGALRKKKIKVGQRVTVTVRYTLSGSTKARTAKVRIKATK